MEFLSTETTAKDSFCFTVCDREKFVFGTIYANKKSISFNPVQRSLSESDLLSIADFIRQLKRNMGYRFGVVYE